MWVSPGSSSFMEVDAMRVNINLVNCIDEQADEQSLSPEFSDDYDVFGDPEVFPRVGEQHQVEIPPLISKYNYSLLQKNSHEAESRACTLHEFRVGLPIPLIWIKGEVEKNDRDPLENGCKSSGVTNKIESSKQEYIKEKTQNGLDRDKLNPTLEVIDSTLVNKVDLGELRNSNVKKETQIGMHEKHRDKDHCLVPGSASGTWKEIEDSSFILGLYIFGKNLVQVKKFIGNKKMGDILSFYYGKFYKSNRYQRWFGCRKMRSRKCIFGQKIFTGPRQQELLSRLLPYVSEECRSKLLEVSKAFVEGKMLLEDYVLTLKATVGLEALVQAVGVGKGKEDLTGLTVDSSNKSTQLHPVRPEIPVGKACSMLTSAEIISFLTGDFRLSKARTSDLFWEAVWPRLLARGWHSEQPCSYNYAVSSKNALVFLVPGVKKFTRKLVKGNHYFDSVSDVLGKVASNPELIELETVADNGSTDKGGNGWTEETKLDRENSPDQPRHCYLKVKSPNRSANGMKFTVVDTSLSREKTAKVRELRSLPFGALRISTSENDSDDSDTSEEETNGSESVNTTCFDERKAGRGFSSDLNGLENIPSKEELPISSMGSTGVSVASKDQKTGFLSNTQRRDGMKCHSLHRMVSDNKIDLVPVKKRRRRLTACSRAKKNINAANMFILPRVKQEEVSFCPDNSKSRANAIANFFVAPSVKQEKAGDHAYNSKLYENVPSLQIPPQANNSLSGLPTQESETLAGPVSNSSSMISTEAVPATSSSGTKDDRHEKTLIDLNLPVAPEAEGDEPFENEVTNIQQNNTSKESDEVSVGTISKPVDHSEHQPDMHARRQSTRNRPPTTKVLEAFACGYLDKKEKRRSRDYDQDSSVSRPSRRACRKVAGSGGSGASSEKEEKANVCNDNDSSNSNVLCTGFKTSEG